MLNIIFQKGIKNTLAIYPLESSDYHLIHTFKEQYIHLPINFSLKESEKNYLCFFIEKQYAALFEFTDLAVVKQEHDLFHYHLQVVHITEQDERVRFLFPTPNKKENPIPFTHPEEISFLEKINNSHNSLRYYYSNLEELLDCENKKYEKNNTRKSSLSVFSSIPVPNYKNINEPHLRAQSIIKDIGNSLNYDTFIAKNDQHRIYHNKSLSENTIIDFPEHNLSSELIKHFSLIDTMWFHNGSPVALFEVEMTTSVYSGILRMADLICSLENPNIQLYIITDRKREKKVRKELERPVFKKIGLHTACKIIFLDDLEILHHAVSFIPGYVKSNVLDKISC